MFEIESSNSRLAKHENYEFACANDLFKCKRNEEVGLSNQTIIRK